MWPTWRVLRTVRSVSWVLIAWVLSGGQCRGEAVQGGGQVAGAGPGAVRGRRHCGGGVRSRLRRADQK
nr:hypothetical protein GCM10010200_100060 [Actinomadura rugatobispora]